MLEDERLKEITFSANGPLAQRTGESGGRTVSPPAAKSMCGARNDEVRCALRHRMAHPPDHDKRPTGGRMIRPVHLISGFLTAVAFAAVAASVTADSPTTVQIRDDCDPTTFDAFIAELSATQAAEKWRFNPDRMSEPRDIVAHNRGGETHSFTKVAKFGGGQVDVLNALSGNTKLAPECFLPSVGP